MTSFNELFKQADLRDRTLVEFIKLRDYLVNRKTELFYDKYKSDLENELKKREPMR